MDDVDFFNVERGSAYERYKRRILREAEGLDSCSEDSDADDADAYYETASEQDADWAASLKNTLYSYNKISFKSETFLKYSKGCL